MAFNHDGSEIAVASSYTHEEGDRAHPKDEIFTREVLDSECLPKPK
jgi:cell cycle arrest protein BUB3